MYFIKISILAPKEHIFIVLQIIFCEIYLADT